MLRKKIDVKNNISNSNSNSTERKVPVYNNNNSANNSSFLNSTKTGDVRNDKFVLNNPHELQQIDSKNQIISSSSNNSKYNITNRNFIFNVRLKKLLTTMDTLQYTTERDAEFNIFFNKALELYDNFITDEEKKIFIAKRKSVMLIDTILMLEWVYDDPTINDNGFNISFNHPIIFLIYKNGVIEKKWYVGYYDNLDICIRYMLHMNAGDKIEFRIKKLLHEIPIRVKKYSMILFQEFITNY